VEDASVKSSAQRRSFSVYDVGRNFANADGGENWQRKGDDDERSSESESMSGILDIHVVI